MKNKGFTLLELLVVIGIIAILISLVSVSYSNAQKSSRDARRKQDLSIIQSAMEQYYTQNDYTYPDSTQCGSTTGGNSCSALSSYVQGGVPTDPMNSGSYVYLYTTDADGTTYSVTATLEKGGTVTINNLQ